MSAALMDGREHDHNLGHGYGYGEGWSCDGDARGIGDGTSWGLLYAIGASRMLH
jgi:hypothetical protein